jgi:hypothetical protein
MSTDQVTAPAQPVESTACCDSAASVSPLTTPSQAVAGPCCGTAADAHASGACCGASAKAEAIASKASCCG